MFNLPLWLDGAIGAAVIGLVAYALFDRTRRFLRFMREHPLPHQKPR